MIIIQTHKKIKHFNQFVYDRLIRSINFNKIECSSCHSHSWTFHAYYDRHTDFFNRDIVIRILRVQCTDCGVTHAVLIQEMIPYSIADFSVICSSVNYSQFTYSSHRFFLIHKYHDIPLRYITLCWMNRRNHPCLFYFPT